MADSRGPTEPAVTRRRAIAVVVAVAAIGVVLALAIGGGDGASSGSDEPDDPGAEQTAATVGEMSDAQLADQVLLLGFEGTDGSAPFLDLVRSRELGGVIVGAGNWADPATGTALVGAIRAAGREDDAVPPLLAAAQEGGRYRTLAGLPPEQTELEIGNAGSVADAEDWSRATAKALRAAGFDLNLAPIADVAILDGAVADRAFSDDPAQVTELTAAAIRGCRSAGLDCAAAHFPGRGAASADTDIGPATVGLDAETLHARELPPFEAAFAEGMPAVVLSLAFYVAYDPVTPGALSEAVATGLLRDELGYEGVAITDDLGAGAVRSGQAVPRAAVRALAAGSDLLRIDAPEDQRGVREAIVTALEQGELTRERLEQAATRVLELKRARGLIVTP